MTSEQEKIIVEEKKETPEEKLAREKQEAFETLLAGVQNSDDRLIGRAFRQIFAYRKKLDAKTLFHLITQNLPDSSSRKTLFLETFKGFPYEAKPFDTKKLKPFVEVEVLFQILLTVFFIDTKKYNDALKCSTDLVDFLQKNSKVTMNLLASKAYFYYSRSYELCGKISEIRVILLNALRTSSLRHDHHGQAMLINLLLRNYLNDNLVDQANKLITKTPNIDFRSNSQLARYFYYKGRIASVQLEYSLAADCLMQAIMKAPSSIARGFRIGAYKLLIIVKLLMGEIPEKSIFEQKGLKKALEPYFVLTRDVRVGDLLKFRRTVEQYADLYKADKTYTLIQRVRQNVIRTGLKKISVAYSKISFADICTKLHLDNPEDVEHIVAKAIRDGIIDAHIDHEHGFMKSKETVDPFSTSEPSELFQNRIDFCLNIRNASVKAMRFPAEKKLKDKEEEHLEDFVDEIVDEDEEEMGDEFGL